MPPLALVAEPDSGTRKLLHVLLERQGCEVDATNRTDDARLLLQHVGYSVIVLNGFDLLPALAPEQQARTVVLSAASERVINGVLAQYPALTVLRKPFDLADLVATTEMRRAPERARNFVETFCRASVRAGAKSGVLLTLDPSSRMLHLVTSFGYRNAALESFCPVSVDAPYPIAAAPRNGVPVWLASLTLAAPEYPLLASVWVANESHALAALPVKRGDTVVGSVGFSFREPQQFSDAQRAALSLIADIASEHLEAAPTPQSGARSTA